MSSPLSALSGSMTDVYLTVWGPSLIGVILACLAQGYLTAVIFSYFANHFRRDRWMNRLVVLVILCFTWADTILAVTKLAYATLPYRFDFIYISNVAFPLSFVSIIFTDLTIYTCQVFMSWRCFSFTWGMQMVYSGSARLGLIACMAIMVMLNLLCLVTSIMLPVSISQAGDLVQDILAGQFSPSIDRIYFWYMFSFSGYIAIDTLITILMTTQFRSARTGFGESDSILQAVINLTMRNGALMTICQIATLITSRLAFTWVLVPAYFISRIYGLTILAILVAPRIAQQQWRDKQDAEARLDSGEMTLSPVLHSSQQFGGSLGGQCVSCGSTSFSSLEKGPTARRGSFLNRGAGKQQSTLEVTVGNDTRSYSDKPITFQAALLGLDEESEADDVSSKGLDRELGTEIGPEQDEVEHLPVGGDQRRLG